MKALVLSKFGSTKHLSIKDVPKPTPRENEVLIKIHATAVNDYDWTMVSGKPYAFRLLHGIFKPRNPIPGMELSGIVEAIGEKVTTHKPGDAVYGDISNFGFGSFAEYISIDEKAVVPLPEGINFEIATTIPHASLLAVQGLIDYGKIKKGEKILINGAGGGVGCFGLQIAKTYDAEVTGVDTGDKLETMKNIGFDHIIDYKKTDFTQSGEQYDLIIDAKTTRRPSAYLQALFPGGRYISVGGTVRGLFQMLIAQKRLSRKSGKSLQILALKSNEGLEYIHDLFEAGKIDPVIDGPYPLEQAPMAIQRFGDAVHHGKVVVKIS
ncbi:MAG: NAD(P)-dependent alcohol dehydrogenase [Bacteroidetes bacterium]|nr:MAG: NAD(P)-dependent alcohol dehydrogenase [Bacteroidota bacterium]